MLASPSVGAVVRDRIFNSVLFPAPLRPITPTASPRLTSNDTLRNAQNVAAALPCRTSDDPRRPPSARAGARSPSIMVSRRSREWLLAPMRYCLPRRSTRMATSLGSVSKLSDHIGECVFHAAEIEGPAYEDRQCRKARQAEHWPRWGSAQ